MYKLGECDWVDGRVFFHIKFGAFASLLYLRDVLYQVICVSLHSATHKSVMSHCIVMYHRRTLFECIISWFKQNSSGFLFSLFHIKQVLLLLLFENHKFLPGQDVCCKQVESNNRALQKICEKLESLHDYRVKMHHADCYTMI